METPISHPCCRLSSQSFSISITGMVGLPMSSEERSYHVINELETMLSGSMDTGVLSLITLVKATGF
jgi:hypothetical protein